ncbi:MAG: hypothetical protein R3B99_23395 [Polyangiales bacterium]
MKRSILLLVLALGCGGGGTYGYAPTYVPLSAEEDHLDAAVDLSYEEVRRDADGHVSTQLGWCGTVERLQVEGDRATVRLSLRTLAPRNLCADETDSSCRVTVSEREGGTFTTSFTLHPEDRDGEKKLWQGSLVRIYGHPTGEVNDEDGVFLETQWYRHWPRGTYVTTAARGSMRR